MKWDWLVWTYLWMPNKWGFLALIQLNLTTSYLRLFPQSQQLYLDIFSLAQSSLCNADVSD